MWNKNCRHLIFYSRLCCLHSAQGGECDSPVRYFTGQISFSHHTLGCVYKCVQLYRAVRDGHYLLYKYQVIVYCSAFKEGCETYIPLNTYVQIVVSVVMVSERTKPFCTVSVQRIAAWMLDAKWLASMEGRSEEISTYTGSGVVNHQIFSPENVRCQCCSNRLVLSILDKKFRMCCDHN